jgi:hypothetical protein
MTCGFKSADRLLFWRRLICEEEERRPGPPRGALGGTKDLAVKGRDWGVQQLVSRSGWMVHR